MRILLGVTAGIAAYKSAMLLRLLKESGHQVDVVPTAASLEFVGKATWEALSGRPVTTGVFESVDEVRHVRLGQEADLIVVAPATADFIARVRTGRADDLLTSSILASEAPKLIVPAMHTEMWQNPATVENVHVLRERGIEVMEPAEGRLTGRDTGKGRMPEPGEIFEHIQNGQQAGGYAYAPRAGTFWAPDPDAQPPLMGRTVVITAGGTREPLDPVRYLGNRSSGKQGIALARAAAAMGAQIHLIAGIVDAALPYEEANIAVERIETAQQLRAAVLQSAAQADALIMAAAVADFRPAAYAQTKIKKADDGSSPAIELERNPDILAEAVRQRASSGGPPVIVGFAAETGSAEEAPLQLAEQKLARKGCDLLVLNHVGEGLVFGQEDTEVHILASPEAGKELGMAEPERTAGTKQDAAEAVMSRTADLLRARG